MSLSFLWASVSLISILISVNSSTCSYSRVEDVCSWALTETSYRRNQKKRCRVIHLYRFRYMVPAWAEKQKTWPFFSMKSPKVRHATHHFQWQKNTIYIYVGWECLKKHSQEIFLKRHMYIVIMHTYICKVSRYVFFFENTVQTGYAFQAGLAKVFCSRCPSWTLVGRFHPPTLRSHTCPLLTAHIWSQDQCSPTLSRQSKIYRWDNILTSPKILFTVLPLWPLTLESELWPVYVDENVNTCKQPPSPDTLSSKTAPRDCRWTHHYMI